jgi:uridine phosphorylase
MTTEMSKILNIMSNDIKLGKSFEESTFYEQSENKLVDATVYAEMKGSYDVYAKEGYKNQFMEDMMNAYLGYYENTLYSKAQGTKVTSYGG